MSPLRGRRTEWVVRTVLVALAVVPALLLVLGPKPARLGFQMYSGYGVTTATWEDARGTVHDVPLGRHLATARNEVRWTDLLPEELCRRLPEAVRVEVRQTVPGPDRVRSVPC